MRAVKDLQVRENANRLTAGDDVVGIRLFRWFFKIERVGDAITSFDFYVERGVYFG